MRPNSLAKSALYNLFGSFTSYIISFVTSLIVARILAPEDYGYLVIAYIFEGIFTLFALDGYEVYYMQKICNSKFEDDTILSVTWYLRLVQSGVLFILQILISIAVIIFGDIILGQMLLVLSFLHLASVLGRTREVSLSKALDFQPIVNSNITRDIVTSISKIGFAIFGFGPLSFAFGQVFGALGKGIHLIRNSHIDIKPIYEPILAKEIFRFGIAVFTSTSGSFLLQQMDRVILSTFYNLKESGFYQFSKSLSTTLSSFVLAPQTSLLMNYMSSVKQEKQKLQQKLVEIGVVLFTFFTPVFFLLVFYSNYYIPFIFGTQWNDSVSVYNMFLIYYYFQFILFPANALLTVHGRPDLKAKILWLVFIPFSVVLLFLAISEVSIAFYAMAFSIAYCIFDLFTVIRGLKFIEMKFTHFLRSRMKFIHLVLFQFLMFYIISVMIPVELVFASIMLSLFCIWISFVLFNKYFAKNRLNELAQKMFGGRLRGMINLFFLEFNEISL